MLARLRTGALHGVDAFLVEAEVSIVPGLPTFTLVGLPQGSVREGRERVGNALRNAGYGLPNRRITVNLAPADVRKDGTAFDLAIALGILSASGQIAAHAGADTAFLGELGLDGTLRPVTGVLPVAARCKEEGVRVLVVPRANAAEASLVDGVTVLAADHLDEVVGHLTGRATLPAHDAAMPVRNPARGVEEDLADVLGQETAKRALEVAAAGMHNLLLIGPPGAGKTMLARRIAGILPPLEPDEALEVTRVHSVAGRLRHQALVSERPFRAPHHSVSYAGLVGGGSPPRPGEVSLAHRGVLFLDELPEFKRGVLEVLRQPLEEGVVRLSRAVGTVRFPADFLLVAAMNPCPCGYAGDGSDRCLCDPAHVGRYLGRVSGPLVDRIDLHVHVPPVRVDALGRAAHVERTAAVADRVAAARALQLARGTNGRGPNARLGPARVRRVCRPTRAAAAFLRDAVEGMHLSARAHDRVLKVARTVADLAGDAEVDVDHVAEAVHYRALDRESAAARR